MNLVEVVDMSRRFELPMGVIERWLSPQKKRFLQAVDGLSFVIEPGQTLGLVGESGCGKSTVAKLIAGLETPDDGQVRINGQEAHSGYATDPQLRAQVQMIFQDPYASLNPRWSVEKLIAEPLLTHHLAPSLSAARPRVVALLEQVGLSAGDLPRYPHQFSGGQRQRLCIARALATEPKFLIADEPTSALDVSVQAQVLNLMKRLQQQQGLSYLFISHNLAVIRHISHRVGVMYLGRLVELSDKVTLFSQPRHPYTRLLLEAIPSLKHPGGERTPVQGEVPNPLNPPSGCAFHPRCPWANERCQQQRPEWVELSSGHRVACHAVAEGRLKAV